ncbi:uncharacterized protein LOC135804788 [Sycon ciliatum]|uniref:uncharacterized protein LOC135804788 n=1 Tax=Sycon ciliatum TaxID=27933 RepID=UPI0031F6088C
MATLLATIAGTVIALWAAHCSLAELTLGPGVTTTAAAVVNDWHCMHAQDKATHCKKITTILPTKNEVRAAALASTVALRCVVETNGPFNPSRPVSISWYFMDAKDYPGHGIFSTERKSWEMLNKTSGRLIYNSSFILHGLDETAYGLYRCLVDDSIQTENRYFFVTPKDFDLTNRNEIGELLSNSFITEIEQLSAKTNYTVLFDCYNPNTPDESLSWRGPDGKTIEDYTTNSSFRRVAYQTYLNYIQFPVERHADGSVSPIAPEFVLQAHSILLYIDTTYFSRPGTFFCNSTSFPGNKFLILNTTSNSRPFPRPPVVSLFPSVYEVLESFVTTRLYCNASVSSDAERPLSFHWDFYSEEEGRVFSAKKRFTNIQVVPDTNVSDPAVTQSTLIIDRVAESSEGTYVCKVTNSYGLSSSNRVLLDVTVPNHDPPVYLEPLQQLTYKRVQIAEPLSIVCSLHGGVTLSTVMRLQTPDGRVVNLSKHPEFSERYYSETAARSFIWRRLRFHVDRANESIAGNYTCTATNLNGVRTRTIIADVQRVRPSVEVLAANASNSSVARSGPTFYLAPGAFQLILTCILTQRIFVTVSLQWQYNDRDGAARVLQGARTIVDDSGVCDVSLNASNAGHDQRSYWFSSLSLVSNCTTLPLNFTCTAWNDAGGDRESVTIAAGSALRSADQVNPGDGGSSGGDMATTSFQPMANVASGQSVTIGTVRVTAWPPPTIELTRLNMSTASPTGLPTTRSHQLKAASETVKVAGFDVSVVYTPPAQSSSTASRGAPLPAMWAITLAMASAEETSAGAWSFVASNLLGELRREFVLSVTGSNLLAVTPEAQRSSGGSEVVLTTIVPITGSLALLVIIAAVIIHCQTKKAKRVMERTSSVMAERELIKRSSSLSMFDMSLSVSTADQLSVHMPLVPLPSLDPEWDFPSDQLSQPIEIGRGAFGVVYKAMATRIVDGDEVTEVALKCSKDVMLGDSETHRRAARDLVHEMTVLKSMGRNAHPNVLSLLKTCTDNGHLVLIMEFCSKGNLLHFLRKRRGHLGFGGAQTMSMSLSLDSISDQSSPSHTSDQRSLASDRESTGPSRPASVRRSHSQNGCTLPAKEDVLRPLDFYHFSAQIASGMAFLAKHKCVHRDLAARNILISEDFVLKVSDFGLARSVADDDHYMPSGSKCVPVKWIAIESLFDGIYTLHSDIWSFGILLWEIASLGCNPYPGVDSLFQFLMDGKRMDKPDGCPDEMFELMHQCWKTDPASRPPFDKVQRFLVLKEKQCRASEESLGYLEVQAGGGALDICNDDSDKDMPSNAFERASAFADADSVATIQVASNLHAVVAPSANQSTGQPLMSSTSTPSSQHDIEHVTTNNTSNTSNTNNNTSNNTSNTNTNTTSNTSNSTTDTSNTTRATTNTSTNTSTAVTRVNMPQEAMGRSSKSLAAKSSKQSKHVTGSQGAVPKSKHSAQYAVISGPPRQAAKSAVRKTPKVSAVPLPSLPETDEPDDGSCSATSKGAISSERDAQASPSHVRLEWLEADDLDIAEV